MVSPSKALDIINHLIGPFQLLLLSISFLPGTILSLLYTLQLRTLLSPSRLQSAWFARFWNKAGTELRINCTPRVGPLIAQAHGVVLDIGPGSGEWLPCFDKAKVERIYGVEPNRECHAKLRERVKQAGLEDIYVLVPVGVEDLGDWVKEEMEGETGLGKGDVDSVVTVFCLCSVSQPEAMIGELYGYLKEGGNWIVFEHVVTKEKGFIAWYQGKFYVVSELGEG
jgi:SAM-dependent methyltransferase